jgi:hypothetical protein
MKRWIVPGALGGVLVAVLLALLDRPPAPRPSQPGSAPAGVAAPSSPGPGGSGPADSPASKTTTSATSGAAAAPAKPTRTRIPRPTTPPSRPPKPVPHADGPVDRTGGKASPATIEAIRAGLDLVREDAEGCVDEWKASVPDFAGEVKLGFDLGPDGLQDVWIIDHTDVPDGPLTCFASAVYGVDWTGVSDAPLEVTENYTVTTADEAR